VEPGPEVKSAYVDNYAPLILSREAYHVNAKIRKSKSRSGNGEQPKKVNICKYGSKNQISEDTSIRLFLNLLPAEWIWQMLAPDYGIDVELDLVEPVTTVDIQGDIETLDPHEQIMTGTILWIQIKSVQKFETKKDEVQFTLETPLLRYALGCQIPIILVVANLETRQLYWLHLQNKYVMHQKTITLSGGEQGNC
jgi:hypothetical protein